MNSVEKLAQQGHGAIEVDYPTEEPLMVFLAGPIKFWWQDGNWDTELHQRYVEWRDAVRVALVKSGFLVYSPHMAFQGAWHEDGQIINNAAIKTADFLVRLDAESVTADGTEAEVRYAHSVGTQIAYAPIGTSEDIEALVEYMRGWKKQWSL